jgi:hypothetical protein
LGCTAPAAVAPTTPAEALKPVRHLEAATSKPLAFQPLVWCSGTAVVTPGPTSGTTARFFGFSIIAGPGTLPGQLPVAQAGALYIFNGNTATASDANSMSALSAQATIVPNATGGGKAVLTGTNTEGLPFTVTLVDNNSAQQADTITIDAPGLFKGSAVLTTGDVRILRALPRDQGAVGQPGIVFDEQIGLFIAQADAANGRLGPQQPVPLVVNEIAPPVAQLPAPNDPPGDTINQNEVSLVRNVPNVPKL